MSSETLSCIFCKQSFDDKETLQVHFRKHADPNFSKARKHTKLKLHNEDSNESEKQEEKPQEMVSCDVCPQVFLTISKAITHKHKAHPDLDIKYFCAWCGKLFTLKYLYQKHLETHPESSENNEDPKFQCDCCCVEFYLPNAMLHHNKFFHRQDSELPNIGQSRKAKLVCQELLPVYYCPFCGEEYINKVNLHKHIGDDHSDEDQRPEDVFSCPLCEALFYHLDAYELHLTFHSTDDVYCGDDKKMPERLPEYTLETVPPILEKVENYDPPEDEEKKTANVIGVNHFLQIAMDEGTESPASDGVEKKSKKRKKHKKSKKASITLDEFLSMNEDVFGQGIDCQGIELVPTQAVTKQLKPKRLPVAQQKQTTSNLEKLRKQGIVIKKPGTPQTIKIGNNTVSIGQTLKIPNMLKSLPVSQNTKQPKASSDVLSKLINSGLKVVKKCTPSEQAEISSEDKQNKESDNQNEDDNEINATTNVSVEEELTTKPTQIPEKTLDEKEASEDKMEGKGNSFEKVCNVTVKSFNPNISSQETNSNITNDNSKISPIDNLKRLGNLTIKTSAKTESLKDNCSSDKTDKDCEEHQVLTGPVSNVKPITPDSIKALGKGITIKSLKFNSEKGNKESENVCKDNENETSLDKIESKTPVETKNFCGQKKPIAFLQNLAGLTIKPKPNNNDSESFSEDDDEPLKSPVKQTVTSRQTIVMSSEQESIQNNHDTDEEQTLDELKKNYTNHTKQESLQSLKKMSGITLKASIDTNFSDEDNEPLRPKLEQNIKSGDPLKNLCKSVTIKTTKNQIKDETMSDDENDNNFDENEYAEEQETINKSQNNLSKKNSPQYTVASSKLIISPSVKSQHSSDLLKNLKNIISKPVVKALTYDTTKNLNETQLEVNKQDLSTSGIDKNIEIFNIDDSDDEDHIHSAKSATNAMNSPIKTEKSTQPFSALKNMSKNVTIKPTKFPEFQAASTEFNENDDMVDDEHIINKVNMHSPQPQNPVLNKVLKNLGQHITVKSQNSSPQPRSMQTIEMSPDLEESDHYNSDSDTSVGKVKITEVTEEHTSDDDDMHPDEGAIDEDPASDHGDDDETYQQQNIINSPRNPSPKQDKRSVLDRLKDITVKQKHYNENRVEDKNKPFKRPLNDPEENADPSQGQIPKKNIKTVVGASAQSSNQSASTSTSQVSTTVKRIQTQTVIEEVTTTVTKTIRTVNQTVQGTQNSATSTTVVRPQKNISNQPSFQGIRVRNATPSLPTKVIPNQFRPAIRAMRPPMVSNQLVPMRPTSNQLVPFRPPNQAGLARPRPQTARMSRPRLPTMNKPSTSSFVQNTNKPLRISPNVINSSVKRPPSHVLPGNCFKKPRLPMSSKDGQNGEYTMSTQMSKSNFTSSTKVVKGNTVMQSTQIKMEMSASCQQIGKLGNMSGLKVVKTQAKQATQVMENNESNTAHTSTLSAIERLQRQGLLVKKPVVEESNDSDHFFSDEDDNQEFPEDDFD